MNFGRRGGGEGRRSRQGEGRSESREEWLYMLFLLGPGGGGNVSLFRCLGFVVGIFFVKCCIVNEEMVKRGEGT